MSAIHDLIGQISDPRLRDRLAAEWKAASTGKKFGLVFEDHLPELLPLPKAKPRRGDLVCRRQGALKDVWQVKSVKDGMVTCVKPQDKTHPSEPTRAMAETVNFAVDEVMVVREFGEPIFPSLVPVDAVANGPADAPWHTLIEADNYHALQLLDYLYAGKVDCIYIDPPYNTGARDWKYNNDYVDGNDSWRHSKWLAFMEKRLKLAKRLLKPNIGVLIATIDDNEAHHLRCLIEEVFPSDNVFSVVIEHNKRGRQGEEFAKTHEYALVVCPDSGIAIGEEPTHEVIGGETRNLRRTGNNSLRTDRPNQFYPVWVNPETLEIVRAGPSIGLSETRSEVEVEGLIPIWPVDKQGIERNWYYGPDRLMEEYKAGKAFARKQSYGIHIYYTLKEKTSKRYKTVWSRPLLDASTYGSELLTKVLGDNSLFSYPKSVYAVRDCISTVILNRPHALVVDFFAGSGTTLNAVNLLNAADGGRRRCILVTNNEVSAEEASALSARGLQAGDDEWEAQGICRSVTWPRSKFTILGRRDDGTLLSGEYLTGKVVEKEKARAFTQIGFVDPASVDTPAKKKQVVALIDGLPQTLVKDPCPFIVSEEYKASILFDPAAADDWLEALDGQEHITDFYIVTPTKRVFDGLKTQINDLLGPILVPEDEKRPMSEGFPANLAYFKLDFLDKDRVTLKRAFREILPLLWLKAGAVGPRPELARGEPEPVVFAPAGSNFVVLLEESRLARLLKALKGRTSLSHVFIVTDSDESFKAMAAEVREAVGRANPDLQVVQLYRDYLVNFMINKRQDVAGRGGLEAMPGAHA
ncbi:MAG: site-specific DNA-methyltransferase [Thiobacillus sp. 65-29]|nr:MAG: site-specific DNA-methyltransferase [Thiobacillus sp. 65-29]